MLLGLLPGVAEDWRAQGATEAEIDLTGFGFDYCPWHAVGVNTDMIDPRQTAVLEETDEYQICLDELGRHVKLFKSAGLSGLTRMR